MGSPSIDPVLSDNLRSVYLKSFYLADLRLQGGPNKASQPFMNSILPDIAGPKTWEDIGPEVRLQLKVLSVFWSVVYMTLVFMTC